ncbi:hypothetical protein Cgig2_031474 [Carnegiea gigantea]|uniref:Uncharacterized protein n=1 Tax=Carnegiea gigantea TaxID=171969 RepID=A0A9Q1GUR3_9CARY|nr:hypothetical protein Cgig2_031474 [Carnegiea gigantea]
MELHARDWTIHSFPNFKSLNRRTFLSTPPFYAPQARLLRRELAGVGIQASMTTWPEDSKSSMPATVLEQPGGKMVAELVGAFNELAGRINYGLSTSSSRILFKALKLSIPLLQSLPLSPDGRSPLSKALSVAVLLADLQMIQLFKNYCKSIDLENA